MTDENVELCMESVDGAAQPAALYFAPGSKLGPIPVGSQGKWRVNAAGVIAEHALLYFDGSQLFLQSLDADNPVLVSGYEVPTEWVAIDPPCTVEIGNAQFAYGPAESEVEVGGVDDPDSDDEVPTEAADETRVVSVHDVMASVARHRATSGMSITGSHPAPVPPAPPSGSGPIPTPSAPGPPAPPAPPPPYSAPGQDLAPAPAPSSPFGAAPEPPAPSGPPSVPTPHSVNTPGSVQTPDSVHTAPLGSSPSGRYPVAPGSHPGDAVPMGSGSYPGMGQVPLSGAPTAPGSQPAGFGVPPIPPSMNTEGQSSMSMGAAGSPPPAEPSAWKRMSFPQKATVILFLPMIAAVLVIFFDIGVPKPPPQSAASPTATASAPTSTATAAESATAVALASEGTDENEGSDETDELDKGESDEGTDETDEGTDETGDTDEADEDADKKAEKPEPRRNKGDKTLQRQAVDAVARANYAEAAKIYEELSRQFPDDKAYAAAAAITKAKAQEQRRD